MQADGEEELSVLGVAQVEMMQHLARQLVSGPVEDFDARAVQGSAHGDEHLAERRADHDLAVRRNRHVHRRELDDEAMPGLVEQHGGRRQSTEPRAREGDDQRNQKRDNVHVAGSADGRPKIPGRAGLRDVHELRG